MLGAAATSPGAVVGVLGDLSFYHDLNGLLAAARHQINTNLIVPDDDGGGIFSMLPQARLGTPVFDEFFTTPHGLDFRHAANLYGCAFERIESWSHFDDAVQRALASTGTNILELPIDMERDIEITRDVIRAGAATASTVHAPRPPQRK